MNVKLEFRPAVLCLKGHGSYSETPVEVIAETPKRYRIICPPDRMTIPLPWRDRYLQVGQTALVPKSAITFKGKPSTVVICKRDGHDL